MWVTKSEVQGNPSAHRIAHVHRGSESVGEKVGSGVEADGDVGTSSMTGEIGEKPFGAVAVTVPVAVTQVIEGSENGIPRSAGLGEAMEEHDPGAPTASFGPKPGLRRVCRQWRITRRDQVFLRMGLDWGPKHAIIVS